MVSIRKARLEDVPAIREIYNEAIANGTATFDTELKSLEDRQAWFTNRSPRYEVLVAELAGEVIGWGSLNAYSDRLAYAATVENSIYVHPSHHGKGAGKMLLEGLLESAKRNEIHCILSRITEGNDLSIKLHERYGFKLVGVMKEVGVKFGKLLDVSLLQWLSKD